MAPEVHRRLRNPRRRPLAQRCPPRDRPLLRDWPISIIGGRICHNFNVSFRALLVVGEHRNENLYDSCDNRGTGGARSRPDGARQRCWQARAKKRRANSRRTAEKEERRKRIQGRAQENSRSDGQAKRPVGKHALSDLPRAFLWPPRPTICYRQQLQLLSTSARLVAA
jgi:hypothetical protein